MKEQNNSYITIGQLSDKIIDKLLKDEDFLKRVNEVDR